MPERKDRISLIIPVYNVEIYLRKCLDSAVTQDYDNYEIIVVDDGSKDGSYGICGEYAERYDNVTLLHKENEGLMATWLKGLEYSTGEYIAFWIATIGWSPIIFPALHQELKKTQM